MKVSVSVSLELAQLRELDEARGTESRSAVIQRLLEDDLEPLRPIKIIPTDEENPC